MEIIDIAIKDEKYDTEDNKTKDRNDKQKAK